MCYMTPATSGYGGADMVEPTRSPAPRALPREDETRAALLAAAHDLLATEGPAALTVRRIATAAGMSTMNVYSRFGGKDGVLDELFIDGFRRLAEAMAESPVTDDPAADLRVCGRTYQRFARANPTYYSLMFDRTVPEFQPSARALEVARGVLGRLVTQVERAMDAGVVARDDPFAVASALWACEHGLASLEARTPPQDLAVFDWDRIAGIAIDAVVRGLAPAP
jgi:AcrR family transcriptional regulator